MVNLSGSLIGLSILTGNNSIFGSASPFGAIEPANVRAAKQNFTTPATLAPWQEAAPTTSVYRQVEEVKRMRTIIDTLPDPDAAGISDVETSFTTYKALDRLRLLAEEAAKPGTTAYDRDALQKAFSKGLEDLQAFLADAPADQLHLYFDQPRRSTESIGIPAADGMDPVSGGPVVEARDTPVPGIAGTEKIEITLTKGSLTRTLVVDLSDPPVPPIDDPTAPPPAPGTLDAIANALNAAIRAEALPGDDGQPMLDENGDPIPRWQSEFTVRKVDGGWGLSFQSAGIEQVALDQVDGADSLMVVAGRSVEDMADIAKVIRFDNVAGAPVQKPLGQLYGIDREATAQLEADGDPLATDDGDTVEVAPGKVAADTTAQAIVTDAQGFSYVVGTTAGDMGSSLSDGQDDLFLTKLDSRGNVVWQRTLGALGDAKGAAVTIADNGDVVIAGTVRGYAGTSTEDSDMLVARFDANGDEKFATTIGGLGDDSASAVTLGTDGSIYVAGKTSTGGGDAYVARLDGTGKVLEQTILPDGGTAGNEVSEGVTALAVDASGDLLVLTREGDGTKLRRLDGQAIGTQLGGPLDLGNVQANAIAVSDSGEIAVAGSANEPVTGSAAGSMIGAGDGFVTRISAGFGIVGTTYVGSAESDQIDSIAFMNGAIYVGGRTRGEMNGALHGKVDGFVARIGTDGTIGSITQFGSGSAETGLVRIAAAAGGTGIMSDLGLRRGTQNAPDSTGLTTRTSLRPDDSFKISIDGYASREITVEPGETMTSLADKVRSILGARGTVSTVTLEGETRLKIDAKPGYEIDLVAGPEGQDVLAKLGIDPGRLSVPKAPGPNDPKVLPGGSYGLQLSDTLSLLTSKNAAVAAKAINDALSMTQTAYRSLYWDSSKEALVTGITNAKGTPYQQRQLANYQAALSRLTGATF